MKSAKLTWRVRTRARGIFLSISSSSAPTSFCKHYMPYTEGPRMESMVDDALYLRFLKWKLKCENILECEFAALPECQKCKKVIAWSGDFGMDQYVSWQLSKEEMNLDTIWEIFKDFWKPQSNDVRAWFDLLTSFHQGNKSVDEWYNAVQGQINLAKYPPETAKILHWDNFCFLLCVADFVSRTITEGSADLDKFPINTVRQLLKKLESFKATACHIKQVAGDLQTTQINLLRHQRTELLTTRHNKKWLPVNKQRQSHHKIPENQATGQVKKQYDNKIVHKSNNGCNKCGDSTHIQGFHCPAQKYQCKVCHRYGHFSSLCYQKKNQAHHHSRLREWKVHQLKACPVYVQDSSICGHSKESSSDESFCLQL